MQRLEAWKGVLNGLLFFLFCKIVTFRFSIAHQNRNKNSTQKSQRYFHTFGSFFGLCFGDLQALWATLMVRYINEDK